MSEFSTSSKMKMMMQRWQQTQQEIDREKHYRQHALQQQMSLLEDRIVHQKPLNQQKLQLLRQKIDHIKYQLKQTQNKKIQVERGVEKKVILLQQNISTQIQLQKAQREEQIENWVKESDSKLLEINQKMENLVSEKSQGVGLIIDRMLNKIHGLQENIEIQRAKRQITTTQITKNIENQLNKLHESLNKQRKVREINNRKIKDIIEQVKEKLQIEIQNQRKSRKQTNNALLMLLQETCNKVEQAFY